MRTKKYIIAIIFIYFLLLNSCSEYPQQDRHSYYKFDSSDTLLILKFNYQNGLIITYENQFGEQIHFKVISNELKKDGDYSQGTFSGGGGILESYYDSKIVRLEIIENQTNYIQEQVIYIFSKSENKFKNGIKFPIWNFEDFTFFDEIDRPFNIYLNNYNNTPRSQFNINGHLFEKVVTIESGLTNPRENEWGALLPNNVNKLYYDYDFGIIQFNDLEGKEWKLIYP